MKKILLTIFLFCCVVALYPQQFEEDGIYYKVIDDTKELEVINNPNFYSGKVVIPSFVMKDNKIYYVRKISNIAFYNCEKLTSIEIPYTVNSIPLTPFSGCSALSEIIVKSGNSVYDSRNNCNAIIETETNTLLIGCKNSVIPNSVTAISDAAFYYCTGLTSIVIPNSVTELGRCAFYGCTNLVEIELSKNITSIGDYAFYNCLSLLSVDIPEGVKNIGEAAFYGCESLKSIKIPSNVTTIEYGAFQWCTSLVDFKFPDSLIKLEGYAFHNTAWYNSLPDGEIYLGNWFYEYKGDYKDIEEITIKTGTYGIAGRALASLYKLERVEIPNSVRYIGSSAFYGCSFQSITIPESVNYIGNYPFAGCDELNRIVVSKGNPVYDSRDNCNAIIETATNTLVQGCKNTFIPHSVTAIGEYAFSYDASPNNLVIPNSVTTIGDYAFYLSSDLQSVAIPNSITAIGNSVFSDTGLKYVDIPNSVTTIGDYAFSGCRSLTSIFIPNSVTSIGVGGFAGCSRVTDIEVESGNSVYDSRYNCNAIIETATNTLVQGCENTVIPNSVTCIGESAFSNLSLKEIVIPNGVTRIDVWGFSGCQFLNSVTIPYTVTSIGNEAFSGCRKLNCLYMECVTPPLVDFFTNDFYSPFENVPDDAILYVPLGSKEKYANAYGWNYFKNIEEYIPTVIDDIKIESSKINNNIYYNLNGNIVDAPTKGVYILNGEKILLK